MDNSTMAPGLLPIVGVSWVPVDLINSLTIFADDLPDRIPAQVGDLPYQRQPLHYSLLPATGDCSDDGDEAWRWSDDGPSTVGLYC
ncbi:hypothetical protein LWI28_021990 [Acer negundo]|uniref:Uncharacterized protein n=1 Tax=Acer negundo TaxID=4023 RepID=A0AAD5P2T8_ACENE|nr:hypothetical protein LWI28_021990 [Acer negundo]